jgi:hypothetical protein
MNKVKVKLRRPWYGWAKNTILEMAADEAAALAAVDVVERVEDIPVNIARELSREHAIERRRVARAAFEQEQGVAMRKAAELVWLANGSRGNTV